MLRITTQHTPDRLVLKLEGRLSAPWVREADACWRAARANGEARAIEIDMRDVWGVDEEGRELLARMHQAGAGFIVCGCAMRELVREITTASVRV
jgi:hypothetical protein